MKNEKIIDYTLNLLTKNKDDMVEYSDGYSRIGCVDIDIYEALYILASLPTENLEVEKRGVETNVDPDGYEGDILLGDIDIKEGLKLVIVIKDTSYDTNDYKNNFSISNICKNFLQSYLLVESVILNDGTIFFEDEEDKIILNHLNKEEMMKRFFSDFSDENPEQWGNGTGCAILPTDLLDGYDFKNIIAERSKLPKDKDYVDHCSIPEPFDDDYDYPELDAILRLNAIASALNLDFNKEGERKINVKKYHIVKEIKQLEDYDKFVSLEVNNSIIGRTVYRSDNEIAELLIRGYFDKHSEEAVKTFDKDLFKRSGKNITIEKAFRTEDRLFVLTKEGKKRYNALLDCTEYFNNERYTLLVDFIDRIREEDKDLYNAIK